MNNSDFIYGFALALDCDYSEAVAHWAAFSRQLSDDERERCERQGNDEGFFYGNECRKLETQ